MSDPIAVAEPVHEGKPPTTWRRVSLPLVPGIALAAAILAAGVGIGVAVAPDESSTSAASCDAVRQEVQRFPTPWSPENAQFVISNKDCVDARTAGSAAKIIDAQRQVRQQQAPSLAQQQAQQRQQAVLQCKAATVARTGQPLTEAQIIACTTAG